jgi:SAM-dependent methyltransferase
LRVASSPSISVVIAPGTTGAGSASLAGAQEVIVVGTDLPDSACANAGSGRLRRIRSLAPAGQRANIGISFASSDWVVVLTGSEQLAPDWLTAIRAALAKGNVCAHRFLPKGGGNALIAAYRPAFAYGSLDGRIDDASQAMEHWLRDIFPRHRHRVLARDGSIPHAADWLERGAQPSGEVLSDGRIPDVPAGPYQAQAFWEAGGRGWVKWEAFQPDEAEIIAMVELVQPRRVLELGCGGGRNGRYFAGAERYAGLDISMPLIERARDRQEKNSIGLTCGDATRLPFASASFDLVFAVSTLQHVPPELIASGIADIVRVAQRHICLIEFTEELTAGGHWFTQPHMFRHEYVSLLAPYADLLARAPTALQVQPAVKEVFLFEKRR